jgi:hypothetical protein
MRAAYPGLGDRFNPHMLFLGGDVTHNTWGTLKEYDGKSAEVFIVKEIVFNGATIRIPVKTASDATIMYPFKVLIERGSEGMVQLKALIKYIFFSTGHTSKAVFGPGVRKFSDLKIGVSAIHKAYQRRGRKLSTVLRAVSPDELTFRSQISYPGNVQAGQSPGGQSQRFFSVERNPYIYPISKLN